MTDVFEGAAAYEPAPAGFRAGEVTGLPTGSSLNVRVYEAPPGESLCPYHYEYEEEWLLVLEGEVTLRDPDGERRLQRGELVCFPAGPAGAHRVAGTGDRTARVMMFSSAREPAVAVYPDSDKIGVWPPRSEDAVMVRRADGRVDYWAGEGSDL